MLTRKIIAASLAASALLMAPAPQAMAALTVDGAVYTVDVVPITNGYDYTLHIDLTGYTGGGSFLDNVAFKPADAFTSFSVVGAPGGVANWTVDLGTLNAGGCGGAGAGWACLTGTANSGKGYSILPLASNSDVKFDVQFTGAGLSTDGLIIKARYVDDRGHKIGTLVSDTVPVVPEPETYALMLAGLGLVGVIARRRLNAD